MPAAEIIAIGTELLLGEIQDTNTRYLARALRDAGVDLYRTMVVGDNIERIAQAIQEAMQRAQIIITTGGLGPTVDDPTRQAVATAAGVELVYMPALWDQITARFLRYGRRNATDNNRRQAYVPEGAIPVENPVGTAPAFIVEKGDRSIISLPGVPREMEYLYENRVLPYLREHFHLQGVIKARVLHTAGVGESQVDAQIGDLETASNPTVGLLAHAGQVDVRITAKALTETEADTLIQAMEAEIRIRLKDAIFGADRETQEIVISHILKSRGHKLAVVECGLGGELAARLSSSLPPEPGYIVSKECDAEQMASEMERLKQETGADVVLGAQLTPGDDKQSLSLQIMAPTNNQQASRSYGGPPTMGAAWAVNTALDFLRRSLLPSEPNL